jgi:cobalamin biosynthesis Mg chelatase CobN
MTTYLIDFSPLHITLTANPQNVSNGNNVNLTAYITADGNPVSGATLTFTSNNGGTFTITTEQGNGYYNATFTAPNFSTITNCTVSASASKTGYLSSQGTTQITVAPGSTATPAPSATPTTSPTTNATNNNMGQLCIKDSQQNPITEALVSAIVQPAGTQTLIDVTNATGYVTFHNVTTGSYTFKIVKEGFATQNETLPYDGQPLSLSIELSGGSSGSGSSSLIIIVAIIVVAIVAAALGGLYFMRRKKSPNVKKLKDLQKQMKPQYQY